MRSNHEIDYHIHGEEMQCVEIELDPQETVIAESGSFMFMDEGIVMAPFLATAATVPMDFLANS